MDARTLEALKASIAKWERNAEAEKPDKYLTGVNDCPLCALFYAKGCVGCPVRDHTGWALCDGSPYQEAFDAWERWDDGDGAADEAHALAREEVAFLKSLLPAEEAQ